MLRIKYIRLIMGGRTEAFKRGCIKDYYYYDINSLYPSVMLLDYPIPDSVNYCYDENRDLLKYEGVSFFELNIPYSKYPLLPYRNKGKLCFPYGKLKGYYTHIEIRRAIEIYGEQIIIKMKDSVYYTRTHKFFKEYVEFMYSERRKAKEQKSIMEVFYKLLMNSLYGRFAMHKLDNTNFFIPQSNEEILKIVKKTLKKSNIHANVGCLSYYTEPKEYDSISSLPIWSCYVTAYARILIHKYIEKLQPVYVDTDSCITKIKIDDSKKLGEMKLEEYINTGMIIKPKMYFNNEKVKIKGVRIPKEERKLLRLKNNIINNKPVKYEKFIRMKEGVKRNIKINRIVVIEKHINLEDDKRNWNGKNFNPNELQESEPLCIK